MPEGLKAKGPCLDEVDAVVSHACPPKSHLQCFVSEETEDQGQAGSLDVHPAITQCREVLTAAHHEYSVQHGCL